MAWQGYQGKSYSTKYLSKFSLPNLAVRQRSHTAVIHPKSRVHMSSTCSEYVLDGFEIQDPQARVLQLSMAILSIHSITTPRHFFDTLQLAL